MADKKDEGVARENAVAGLDFGGYEGQGFENQTGDDLALPFLNLLQALSPQIETIDGAKAGMLFNSVTQRLYDGSKGVLFVPAITEHVFVQRIPSARGGGFVAEHALDSDVVTNARERAKAEGKDDYYLTVPTDAGDDDLVECYKIFGVLDDEEGTVLPCVISFDKTKIKVYKKWVTTITGFQLNRDGQRITPPLFAHLTRVTSVKETNRSNQTYHNFALTPVAGSVEASLIGMNDGRFVQAKTIHEMVKSGQVTTNYAGSQDSEPTGPAPDSAGDDVPF